jgi:hypothetical protein
VRDLVEVVHVEMLDANIEPVELFAFMTDGGNHVPAVGGLLAREFEADAPVRTGDQDSRHVRVTRFRCKKGQAAATSRLPATVG